MIEDDDEQTELIQVRPYNLKTICKIRELDPVHIDRLITLRGIVIRNSDIIPEMKEAYFQCSSCKHHVNVMLERARLVEPDDCPGCKKRGTYALIHNRCIFGDKQTIKL